MKHILIVLISIVWATTSLGMDRKKIKKDTQQLGEDIHESAKRVVAQSKKNAAKILKKTKKALAKKKKTRDSSSTSTSSSDGESSTSSESHLAPSASGNLVITDDAMRFQGPGCVISAHGNSLNVKTTGSNVIVNDKIYSYDGYSQCHINNGILYIGGQNRGPIPRNTSWFNIGGLLQACWSTISSANIGFSSESVVFHGNGNTVTSRSSLNLNPLPVIGVLYSSAWSLAARAYTLQKNCWPCKWLSQMLPWSKRPPVAPSTGLLNTQNVFTKNQVFYARTTSAPATTVVPNVYQQQVCQSTTTQLSPEEYQAYMQHLQGNINTPPQQSQLPVLPSAPFIEPVTDTNTISNQVSPYAQNPFLAQPSAPFVDTPTLVTYRQALPASEWLRSLCAARILGEEPGTHEPCNYAQCKQSPQQQQSTVPRSLEPKMWQITSAITKNSGHLFITCDPYKKEGPFLKRPKGPEYIHNTSAAQYLNLPGVRILITEGSGNIIINGIGVKTIEEARENKLNLAIASHSSGHIRINEDTTDKYYVNYMKIYLRSSGNCIANRLLSLDVDAELYSSGKTFATPVESLKGFTKSSGIVYCYTKHENLDTEFDGNVQFIDPNKPRGFFDF
jgi:hypothetical protein